MGWSISRAYYTNERCTTAALALADDDEQDGTFPEKPAVKRLPVRGEIQSTKPTAKTPRGDPKISVICRKHNSYNTDSVTRPRLMERSTPGGHLYFSRLYYIAAQLLPEGTSVYSCTVRKDRTIPKVSRFFTPRFYARLARPS